MKQRNFAIKLFRLILASVAGVSLVLVMVLSMEGSLNNLPNSISVAFGAGTINVTTSSDEYADPGPGAGCSLREAIEAINTGADFGGCTNAGSADVIQLQAATYTVSITKTTSTNATGSLQPETDMTIQGAGANQTIISGTTDLNDWILYLNPSVATDITLDKFTVQGGSSGGIYADLYGTGTIVNFSNLIVQNNQGSGIYIYATAPDIESYLTNVLIQNNQKSGSGAGLYAQYGGETTLKNVTIYNNKATGFGGGIYYYDQYGTDMLAMTNVTIYSNTAQNSGGGLYLPYNANGGITATNATIANNRAINTSGGNIYNNNSTVSLNNSIVANGVAGTAGTENCGGNPSANITSLGYNLDSGDTCLLSGTGDITDTNPLLDSTLADNGGSTPTIALLVSSPAISKANPATPGSGSTACPTTDQREYGRAGRCDIGAYEYNGIIHINYLPVIFKNN